MPARSRARPPRRFASCRPLASTSLMWILTSTPTCFRPYCGPYCVPPAPVACGRFEIRSAPPRSEKHTSELQSHFNLVCRLLLEKKKIRKDLPPTAKETTCNLLTHVEPCARSHL